MNEHTFRKSFERELKKSLNWHWKIHDQFAGGVPDAFYEGTKQDLWVEYKWLNLPKRPTTLIDFTKPEKYLSKLQQLWLTRRHEIRGDTMVIVGHDKGCLLLPGLDWTIPRSAGDLVNLSTSKKEACTLLSQLINK